MKTFSEVTKFVIYVIPLIFIQSCQTSSFEDDYDWRNMEDILQVQTIRAFGCDFLGVYNKSPEHFVDSKSLNVSENEDFSPLLTALSERYSYEKVNSDLPVSEGEYLLISNSKNVEIYYAVRDAKEFNFLKFRFYRGVDYICDKGLISFGIKKFSGNGEGVDLSRESELLFRRISGQDLLLYHRYKRGQGSAALIYYFRNREIEK